MSTRQQFGHETTGVVGDSLRQENEIDGFKREPPLLEQAIEGDDITEGAARIHGLAGLAEAAAIGFVQRQTGIDEACPPVPLDDPDIIREGVEVHIVPPEEALPTQY